MNTNNKKIFDILKQESKRQKNQLTFIASENYTSKNIRSLTGSILTNKYAEGYPGNRYYGGCEYIDKIELLAIENLKKLFNVKFANVQPHSGSQANEAAYNALLKKGDKILAMSLSSGGHLSHGAKFNFSGKIYESVFYDVDKETNLINYDLVRKIAKKEKPKLIIAGASAYSREIDFKKFRKIADEVGSYLLADISHISGLIASGIHNSPIPYAHIVSSTTHKTLRGPRSGVLMTNYENIINLINKSVFPGIQGGPLEHVIAAKAMCFDEATKDSFINYQTNVVKNSKLMASLFMNKGFKVVTNGTDNHLFLVDTYNSIGITGKTVQEKLLKANIVINMNSLPFDVLKTSDPSGIRLGTAAITTLEISEKDLVVLTESIINFLKNIENDKILLELKLLVKKLTKKLWTKQMKKKYGS